MARRPQRPKGPSPRRLGVLVACCVLAVAVPRWLARRQRGPPPPAPASPHDLQRAPPRVGDGLLSQWSEISSLNSHYTDRLDPGAAEEAAARAETRADAVAACLRHETTSGERLWGTADRKRLVFVHVPKCGGSALTAVLRRVACAANKDPTSPCCLSPGFCQRDKRKLRLCPDILNCHSHQPQLALFFGIRSATRHLKAVTMVRGPVGRAISAWHYRCHNPNWDCFHIAGSVQWAERRRAKHDWYAHPPNRSDALPWVSFASFLGMEHYQNVQTRMLGRDRFPYSPTPVDALDVGRATSRFDAHFAVVGVFELFEHSAALVADYAGVPVARSDFLRVRAAHTPRYAAFAAALKSDAALRGRALAANAHDGALHGEASRRLCRQLRDRDILELPGCGDAVAARARAFCASY